MEYTNKTVQLARVICELREFTSDEESEIGKLMESMKTQGLLHPITVMRADGEESEHRTYKLITGLRRYVAATRLEWKMLSVRVCDEQPSEFEEQEIAIDENLRGANRPWHELVVLEKKRHELRQAQHGKGKQGTKSGWSLRDTAAEMEIGLGTLSEDLRLADAVMADPQLRNIKDKMTAKRLIFNKAQRMEDEAEAGLDVKMEANQLYLGDSSVILKHFPDDTFDVCFTDPPWLEYKDKSLVKDSSTLPVFKELFRVMKPDSFMYVICSTPDFYVYLTELYKIGWRVMQMPLIWHKLNVVSHGLRPWEYNRDYEPILLAVKGNPVLSNSGINTAVFTCPAVHPTKLVHPNEKPVAVPKYFLEHCSYEGSFVIDPFGGSGVTAEACIETGRRYVTIERSKEFYDQIESRLATAKLARQARSESAA